MATVTQKTKQILVLCGSLMLTGSAFAMTGDGDGGDENTPSNTPRTAARLLNYSSLFSAIGSMTNHIGINRTVRKFIKENYPDGISHSALDEFGQQLTRSKEGMQSSVYNHLTKTLLPLYTANLEKESRAAAAKRGASSYEGDDEGDPFSRALTLSTRPKVARTVLGDITNTVDGAMSPLTLPPLFHRRAIPDVIHVMMMPPDRGLSRRALPPIPEESTLVHVDEKITTSLLPIPELFDDLNHKIIGEEPAMTSLATGFHVHYTIQDVNERLSREGRIVRVPKQNIFMCGPTGCGKTASVRAIANKMGRVFYEADATGLTRTGYVGESASSVIVGLVREAKNQVADLVAGTPKYKQRIIELVQRGVVFLDEFDKIGAKKSGASERDIGGADVQAELLKLMEGKKITIKVDGEEYSIDTTGILFIAGGAFSSIERKGAEVIAPEAFVEAGFSEQVLGRFGRKIFFEGMTPAKFERILHADEASPLTQNLILLEMGYGIHVNFDEDAMRLIAERGYAMQAGVRGLTSIVNATVDPLILRSEELKGTTFIVDRAFVETTLPKIEPQKKVAKPYTFEDHIRDHPREEYGFYN